VTRYEDCEYCNEGQVCAEEDVPYFSWDAESFSADMGRAAGYNISPYSDQEIADFPSQHGIVCSMCGYNKFKKSMATYNKVHGTTVYYPCNRCDHVQVAIFHDPEDGIGKGSFAAESFSADWQDSQMTKMVPSLKCKSCGHEVEDYELPTKKGLQACPKCEPSVWKLYELHNLIDRDIQIDWEHLGYDNHPATLDSVLQKKGYTVDNFPQGIEIEMSGDYIYKDPKNPDIDEIIGMENPAKVRLFAPRGDWFEGEYFDGKNIISVGDYGERLEYLVLQEMGPKGPEGNSNWNWWGSTVKIGGSAPQIEFGDDSEFIKIDGQQYDRWPPFEAESFAATTSPAGTKGSGMSRLKADAIINKVKAHMGPHLDFIEVCGSYRRGNSTPKDLDFVVIPKKGVTLPNILPPNQGVNWVGDKKAQVVIDNETIDFHASSLTGLGAALMYFTGPAGYNIGMRMRAKKMGLKLNEYGVFDRNTGAYIAGATEADVYQALGKPYKSPDLRGK
jgi:hypothetical protein